MEGGVRGLQGVARSAQIAKIHEFSLDAMAGGWNMVWL